jgi:hypothetical protein
MGEWANETLSIRMNKDPLILWNDGEGTLGKGWQCFVVYTGSLALLIAGLLTTVRKPTVRSLFVVSFPMVVDTTGAFSVRTGTPSAVRHFTTYVHP